MTERTVSLAEKKSIIIDFLQRCNHYSDKMLEKYQSPLTQEAPQKVHDWTIYKEFNEYAINELNSDDLDDWFK
ncbi:MAG: hypothetical protein COB62_03250 [Piscirickettsiaceae bacterium]|nr:MAG: hypothetical protein COB62_03250 [Piscirickettsiaceae bacterium]